MERRYDSRPIGVFDSGVGGLTVFKAVARRFPDENLVYLGDTARVPYGSKSPRTVERYTLQVGAFLQRRGVKGIVVACNTASALGLDALRARVPLPILGVIQPGCRMAVATTRLGRVGVIGTRSTMASGAYPQTLSLLDPGIYTVCAPCPLFVPLVEEGWIVHPATRLIVAESLASLHTENIDTLILGCTHYPLLRQIIQEVMGPNVHLIDSAAAVARELEKNLSSDMLPAPPGQTRILDFWVTDVADRFQDVARLFLEELPVASVNTVDL
ncbi:MAG: glutamate racemase [Magnetococcales bacterium]|nr:glutamate racemase [Magnetococcales bacterium]